MLRRLAIAYSSFYSYIASLPLTRRDKGKYNVLATGTVLYESAQCRGRP